MKPFSESRLVPDDTKSNNNNYIISRSKVVKEVPHLVILAVDESKFKLKLCWIYSKNSCFAFPVKTIDTASL